MWTPTTRYPDPAIEVIDPSFARYRVFSAGVERLATDPLQQEWQAKRQGVLHAVVKEAVGR